MDVGGRRIEADFNSNEARKEEGMSKARESMSWAWVPIRVIAVVVALGAGWVVPNGARGEDELQQAQSEAGQVWYEKFCRPCHGKLGAPGSAVYPDSKEPVDLRTYVQRHGGKFPASNWLAIVAGSPRSAVHSKVWEKIRSQQGVKGSASEAAARGIVASIAQYVMSLQTK